MGYTRHCRVDVRLVIAKVVLPPTNNNQSLSKKMDISFQLDEERESKSWELN
ncbi:hypothetical protein KJ652_03325 [Patescibacteria group bacterium]|nr:hypothetical protein [Patescibacteria group bacterium]MBU1123599.1 hypothetical protein [Patescibacteria group bacterium]